MGSGSSGYSILRSIKPQSLHAWTLPGLITAALAAGSLGPSTYFLHVDTPQMDVTAANLIHGCWTATGKPGIAILLTLPFALGGISPQWETLILGALAALTIVAFFLVAVRLTGSKRWAMLGALWFLSLPGILYYTRMHMGYPLAFFTLGVWLQSRRRYGLAGLAFGQAFTSHSTMMVPIGAWLGWSFLLHDEGNRFKKFALLAVSMLPPILAVESLTFLFNRNLFGWSRGRFSFAGSLSTNPSGTTWTHLWEVVRFTTGWINAALLLAGLLYPLVRRPRLPFMDAIFLAGWSVVGLYTVRAGLTHTAFAPRLLVGVYPLLAWSAIFTLRRLLLRLSKRLPPAGRATLRSVEMAVVAIALPLALINHTLDAAVTSRTAYDRLDAIVADAAEAGLPVRFAGNPHVGRFFSLRHRVEMSINETSLDVITGDTLAVLIFEESTDPTLLALKDDPRVDPEAYVIDHYPHRTDGRSVRIEGFGASTQKLVTLRSAPFARQPGAATTSLEVWWPRNPNGSFETRIVRDYEAQRFVEYLEGGPCTTPEETVFYYEILQARLREISGAVAAGEFATARSIIGDMIRQ